MLRELALHILDLAENSLNAGATLITIEVVENLVADQLVIRVSDNGRGMDAETIARYGSVFHHTLDASCGTGFALFETSH